MGHCHRRQFFTGYEQVAKAAVAAPSSGGIIRVFAALAINRSGGDADVGWCRKLAPEAWKFGTVLDASTPDLTNATATIQAASAVSIFTTTANSGFLVQSAKKFGLIGLTLSQAQTGSPVYAFEYWNGSAWTALTTIKTPVFSAAADIVLAFAPPRDWAFGEVATVGVDSDKYAIRVRATTAPGQAVIATAAWVSQFITFQPGLPDLSKYSLNVGYDYPLDLEGKEELHPYFSVASASNIAEGEYFEEN